ncbi:hypothetical protein DFQ28_005415 [Apophysomyces sp. BC1034]|nr:hypothetical protein DFQ30_010973 [Apophysomyces sp. BC1015]KAG0182309.1 hypothetical protein DFQ29_004862 [Apophysomyces sp. BC1021]KAG0193411.1 hypothetical protein DFQ28_005415 [Apophysomyces sp. BC1034]
MLNLIIAAVQAILQVMVIVFFGFCLTRMGYFNMEKQKWLSKLNLVFFTPCLLFSNIASTISFEKLLAFWPIPVFYVVFGILNYICSQTTTRVLGLNAAYRRFVLACVMFSNTNSLPIATITSLAVSEAGKILFWNADDTQESVAARGISYTLFFAIFGNLVRWSYGYNLLRKHHDDDDDDEEVVPPMLITPGYNYLSTNNASPSSASSLSIASEADLEHQPDRRLSTLTLAAQADDPKVVDETTGLLATFPTYPALSPAQEASGLKNSLYRLALRFHKFMSPPLYAAMLALIVGLSPLKAVLYDPSSFLYPSFTKAIEICGKAAVPLILTCLGAQLTCIARSQHTASPAVKKPVAVAIGCRMLLAPLFVIPTVVLFVMYGAKWSTLATDPVFNVMMIVLGSSPTAINLVQITQVNNIFEDEMLRMLFWSYGVVCVPICTLTVFIALSIVAKLL